MIPTFLHSIAAQVRTLVREGKALHVSDKTADELELVAGLDWSEARYHITTATSSAQCRVTPCDIAWVWLKLSQAPSIGTRISSHTEPSITLVVDPDAIQRAAECAELATIASRIDEPNGQSIELDGEELRLCSPVNPHEGTREGARAAWKHVAREIFENFGSPAAEIKGHPAATEDLGFVKVVHDRYRRELEAL